MKPPPSQETPAEGDKPSQQSPDEGQENTVGLGSEEQFDPFSDGTDSAWNDPEAFYDRPPPARPAHIPSAVPAPSWNSDRAGEGDGSQKEDGHGPMLSLSVNTHGEEDEPEDTTGGSAYMDTSQFLRRDLTASDPAPVGLSEDTERSVTPTEGCTEGASRDLHVGSYDGPYDFPSALASFPASREKREGMDEGQSCMTSCTCTCTCM